MTKHECADKCKNTNVPTNETTNVHTNEKRMC